MKENALNYNYIKRLLRCFLIGIITSSLAFVPFIINRKGALIVCDDYDIQYIPFAQLIWKAVHDGDQWVWNIDLGCSLINGFSYYNLGSPFLWISLLFPRGFFVYLSGVLQILKYSVACVNAYIYLSCFQNEKSPKDYALLGALLYAFSGFQSINLMFGIFHDEVAFFPLLLWGIENIDNKKMRPIFILSIFINCLVNYFLFIQEVVFIVLYFVIRYWNRQTIKEFFYRMIVCLMCGLLGVGMASVLFVPSIMYITGNVRSNTIPYISNLFYDSKTLLYTIKGILFPAEIMTDSSAIINRRFYSTSCYLPLFGLSGVIAFLFTNKGWLRRFIFVLFLISLFPLAQSAFLLFTIDYQRWWYMFVLVMVLATVQVLERPKENLLSRGIAIYIVMVTAFYIIVTFLPWDKTKEQIIFHKDRLNYYFIISIFGLIIIDILIRSNKLTFEKMMVLVMIYCVITTGITMHYYRYYNDSKAYLEKYEVSLKLKTLDSQYRYNTIDNVITCVGDVAGIGTRLSSTIENSSHNFDNLLSIYCQNKTGERKNLMGVGQLLGGKYYVSYNSNSKNIVYEVNSGNTKLYVSEGKAVPIGVALDYYIYANELYKLPQKWRVKALMNSSVIIPSDEKYVVNAMRHIDVKTINFNESIDNLLSKLEKNAVKNFSRDGNGFSCNTDFETDRVVFFSVPNDEGWTARIDGEKTNIIDSSGLMLINVPKGNHTIEFTFYTVGLNMGIVISIISWISFVGLLFAVYCRKSKEDMNVG